MFSLATVTPRNETVYLARLKKEDISQCALAIMKLLLYQSEDRFFSYTEYEDDISLIVDETIFPFFPPEVCICKEPWNVIQLDMGSCGIPSEAGVVSLVGSLLAQQSINVHYVSTFHHDYVLVQKKHFPLAVNWLKQNLEDRSDTPSLLQLQPPAPSSSTANQLVKLKSSVYFASCGSEKIGKALQHLLKIIFFETNSRFFSFTSVDDELSLLLDKEHLDLFPNGCLVVTEQWQPIKREQKDDLFETGVVGYISSPLAKVNIAVLYLSTYNTSFILVPTTKFDNAVATLENRNFNVMDRKPQLPTPLAKEEKLKYNTKKASPSMPLQQISSAMIPMDLDNTCWLPPQKVCVTSASTPTTTSTIPPRSRILPTKPASMSNLGVSHPGATSRSTATSILDASSMTTMNMNNIMMVPPHRVAAASLFDPFDRVDIASYL